MKKIFLAVPTSNFVESETVKAIYNLSIPEGYEATLEIVQGYAVHQARNILTNAALQGNYDYIFWIDADIILPKDILKCLIEDDKDIICGYYIKKVENQRICELFGPNPQDPEKKIISNVLENDLPKFMELKHVDLDALLLKQMCLKSLLKNILKINILIIFSKRMKCVVKIFYSVRNVKKLVFKLL